MVENAELELKPPVYELPFEFSNEIKGKLLAQEELDNFTTSVTSFWNRVGFFDWLLRSIHGVHESTGMPDYAVWWDDVGVIKQGSAVKFKHLTSGGGHNILIPTSQLLSESITGYLLTGNVLLGDLTNQLCKGVTALMKGMQVGEDDLAPCIMARNIIPINHSYEINGGIKEVDYDDWRSPLKTWNTDRFMNPDNPYWGQPWVTGIRSKDGLPHLFRVAAYLPDLISNGQNSQVVSSAINLRDYLIGFCRDIVDNDYHIRSKNSQGNPYVPRGDLVSFVNYGRRAEANARLVVSLIGYGDNNVNCGNGCNRLYDSIATRIHYYNLKIIQGFHMDAVLHSLINGDNKTASNLLRGLKSRVDKLMSNKRLMKIPRYKPDLAVFLLQAGSVGLPLNHEQVRLIQSEYLKSINAFEGFPLWNLWSDSVPDGVYDYKPNSDLLVRPEELGHLLEYAYSPYKSPQGERVVNTELMRENLRLD